MIRKIPSILFGILSFSPFLNAQSNFPTKRSDLIAQGKVVSSESVYSHDQTRIYTVYKLAVKRLYKGDLHQKFVNITVFGGQVGDHFQAASENINLSVGETDIFFLWQNELKLKAPYSNSKLYFPVDGNNGIVRLYQDKVQSTCNF